MKKKFTKLTALALATAMIASSFVGCGSTDTATTDTATTEEAAPAEDVAEEVAEAPAEAVTIRWVTCANGGSSQKDIDMVMEEFNLQLGEILPGVTVQMDRWLTPEYKEKFDLALAAGEVIDVAWKGYMCDTAQYYAQGTFLDLNEYVDADVLAAIPEFLVQGATVNGELAYLPKIEMHHWVEGMYTSQTAFDAYFPVDLYEEAMADYYENSDINYYTDKMYEVFETYMANAEADGAIGSGFSPYVARMNDGLELVKGATYGKFPASLAVPATPDTEWDLTVLNPYAQEHMENFYAKLAEWKDKGWMRNDLVGMDNPRQFENTNADGNLIWFHNYVNADDPTCTDYDLNHVRADWADEYVVVPFCTPLVSAGSSDGLCIPYTAANPEVAMDVIELMYTEEGKELKRLLTFGIEGVHHTIETVDGADYAYFTEDAGYAEDDTYGMAVWMLGNTHTSYLTEGQKPNQYEAYGQMIDASMSSPIIGFNLDLTAHDAAITSLRACIDEYVTPFMAGEYTPEKYDEFLAKLETLGLSDLLADFQAQIDAEFK
ncbi:MAG: ABC transporter substrate-binding protein [Eubacteriales bacterium]